MRIVPFSYIARNLWGRRVTTLLTALGMALVVYVFATVLMMSEGIRSTMVATGQADNVMVLRKGAGAEAYRAGRGAGAGEIDVELRRRSAGVQQYRHTYGRAQGCTGLG